MIRSNFDDMFSLNGKVAIVTGCSSGIGIELARGLAKAGADVVICARRKQELFTNAQEIAEETGRQIIPIVADISKEQDVQELVETAIKNFGHIDILVNNAGICQSPTGAENLT